MIKHNQQRKLFHFYLLKTTSKGHKTADNLFTAFSDQTNHINFTDRHYRVSDHIDSHRNVCESRIFMKKHIQIYVPKCPRTYEKNLLNLLKSSIPDISTSTLTIFSVKTFEKLCRTMKWRLLKPRLLIFKFLKID